MCSRQRRSVFCLSRSYDLIITMSSSRDRTGYTTITTTTTSSCLCVCVHETPRHTMRHQNGSGYCSGRMPFRPRGPSLNELHSVPHPRPNPDKNANRKKCLTGMVTYSVSSLAQGELNNAHQQLTLNENFENVCSRKPDQTLQVQARHIYVQQQLVVLEQVRTSTYTL